MAITDLPRRLYSTPTGDLTDPADAVHVIEQLGAATATDPHLAILDLSGKLFSPASLRDLILRVGRQARGRVYGDMKLVVVSSDPAVLEAVSLLSREHELPIFIASSRDPGAVEAAAPAGDLTPAEQETLAVLRELGGIVTISRLAEEMDLEPTAANNRLVNVVRKGYIHRIGRSRQLGDLFVDPRTRREALVAGELERDAVSGERAPRAGFAFERSPARSGDEAARRAQEIIRRHR